MAVPVYVVDIDGEKRKAMDLIGLKGFLESKKAETSPLNLDPNKIGDVKAIELIAVAARNVLAEIEYAVDLNLGLIKPATHVEAPKVEESEADKNKIDLTKEEPEKKPEVEAPKEPAQLPEVKDNSDEEIII